MTHETHWRIRNAAFGGFVLRFFFFGFYLPVAQGRSVLLFPIDHGIHSVIDRSSWSGVDCYGLSAISFQLSAYDVQRLAGSGGCSRGVMRISKSGASQADITPAAPRRGSAKSRGTRDRDHADGTAQPSAAIKYYCRGGAEDAEKDIVWFSLRALVSPLLAFLVKKQVVALLADRRIISRLFHFRDQNGGFLPREAVKKETHKDDHLLFTTYSMFGAYREYRRLNLLTDKVHADHITRFPDKALARLTPPSIPTDQTDIDTMIVDLGGTEALYAVDQRAPLRKDHGLLEMVVQALDGGQWFFKLEGSGPAVRLFQDDFQRIAQSASRAKQQLRGPTSTPSP